METTLTRDREPDKTRTEGLPDPADALTEAAIPFTRGAGDPAGLVTSYLLGTRRGARALLMMPKGVRADFRALARRLGTGHLSLAGREAARCYGQRPATLSPFALLYDEARRLQPVLDERLLAQPALGFPGVPGTLPLWLDHAALIAFLGALGYRTVVGDWAAP